MEAKAPAPDRVADNRPLDIAMGRYAAGDDAAFAALYDLLAPRLYRYLLRQTRESSRAEDLVQQTFLQMHRARGQFVIGAAVVPWSYAIARRLFLDHVRRGRREVLAASDDVPDSNRPGQVSTEAAADELVGAGEIASRIHAALATLPDSQRVAFELLKYEELSVAEAAAAVGATPMAVKLRAHRAYEALRAALGDLIGADPSERGAAKL